MRVLFFFFQAEDGIRDLTVTGVQTCALPICFLACFVPEEMESRTLNFVQELLVRSFVGRACRLHEGPRRSFLTTSQRCERRGEQTDSPNPQDFSSGKGALANHLQILAYFVIWSV